MSALIDALRQSQSLDEAWIRFSSRMGPFWTAWLLGSVGFIATVFVGVFLHSAYQMIAVPAEVRRLRKAEAKAKDEANKKKKQQTTQSTSAASKAPSSTEGPTKRTDSPTPPPAAGPQPQQAAAFIPSRSRPLHSIEPASTLRGFPRVGVCAISPCQRYWVVSCRQTFKARVYPQGHKAALMRKGKELQDQYFLSLSDAISDYNTNGDGPKDKVDICAVMFTSDGSHFIAMDAISDSLFVCSTDGKSSVQVWWSRKLPKDRSASSFLTGQWTALSSDSNAFPTSLVTVHSANAEVEVLMLREPGAAPIQRGAKKAVRVSPILSLIQKFKVGTALCWDLRGCRVAVGGSFMTEPRTATIQLREQLGDMQLAQGVHVSSKLLPSVPPTTSSLSLHAIGLALVLPGVPSFNTRELLVVIFEGGYGAVYDISGEHRVEPILRSTFLDPDAAVGLRGVCVATSGEMYKETLHVALWTERDVSVWVQTSQPAHSLDTFRMEHAVDYHDAHAQQRIARVTFLQNGLGLATTAVDEGHIKLWEIPTVA